MDKLISMTDFVLEQNNNIDNTNHIILQNIVNYALFLKQPLTLGMFVPCKLVDGVLEEPDHLDYKMKNSYNELVFKSDFACNNYHQAYDEYQEAKERVLFEGIEYVEAKHESSYNIVIICKSLSTINYPEFWKNKTIEYLIPYNLNLTQSAKQKIGL